MKICIRNSFCLLTVFALGSGINTAVLSQDLDNAVRLALRESPALREADLNRQAIESEYNQARAQYLPQVDAQAQAGPSFDDSGDNSSGGDDTGVARGASLSVTQMLYDGGGVNAEVDRQTARIESASLRFLDRAENLALGVTEGYLNVLRAEAAIEVSQEQINNIERIYGAVQRQLDAGEASQTDIDQVAERLVRAQSSKIEFEADAADARSQLIELVGVPVSDFSPVELDPTVLPPTLEEAILAAADRNITLQVLAADIRAADSLVNAAEASLRPGVNLEGRVAWDDDSDFNRRDNTTAELLLVTRWNLYRGGRDKENVVEQKLRVQEAWASYDRRKREVERQAREAWDQRFFDLRRASQAVQQERLAKEIAASREAQFLIGETALLDVLDAYNEAFNASIGKNNADYAAMFAGFRLLAVQSSLLDYFTITQN